MGKKKNIRQAEEIRKAMEQRICAEISTVQGMRKSDELQIRRLALALYHGGTCLPIYRSEVRTTAKACLIGTDPYIFQKTLVLLFGEQEAEDLLNILKFRIEGNLSEAIFRTPFHSNNPGDYIEKIILPTIFRWVCGSGCDLRVIDWLMDPDIIVSEEYDLSNRLGLELQRSEEIGSVIMQILRQDPEAPRPVSREILQAVLRSDFQPGIQQLKTILTDKNQDTKLKELILSMIDEGTSDTFVDFLHCIHQEKLYRSPVVAREIDTWLWLGFGALEPQMAELILEEALAMLEDKNRCYRAIDQGDMLKIHIALWALAVRNLRQIRPILWEMLQNTGPNTDLQRKISAIYFITNVQHEYLEFDITLELLEQAAASVEPEKPYGECMELLAWLMPNLIPTDLEERLRDHIPYRQHYFSLLERVLHLIGNEERIFCGKPFVWTMIRLTPELAVEAMLRTASISKDRSMIRSLARNIDYFTPKQRGFFYEYLLDPMHWREDDFFLREHQKDRSSVNRQVIQEKLDEVRMELEQNQYQTDRW